MVRSAGGVLSWKNRMRNDGSAIMTRTTTGMTVHNTSTNVLCVVRDGVGWTLALNFTITITSNARTNTVMAVMIHNTKVWSQITSSITGLPETCKPSCHGVGCPKPANAAPSGIRRAAARAAIAMVRKRTGMVVSTPRVAPACGHLHHELRIPHKVRICFGCVGGRSGRAPAHTLSQPARPGPHQPQFHRTRNVEPQFQRTRKVQPRAHRTRDVAD